MNCNNSLTNCETDESPNAFKERFERLFNDTDTTDCEFEFASEMIKGHRMIFAMASPVFKAMFYGELREETAPIKIIDLEPDVFKGMKQFIYTDGVDFTSCIHACSVYVAGRKYLITDLCMKCVEHLKNQMLSKLEVFEVYEFAKKNDISEIETLCCELFQQETRKIMESDQFLLADIDIVETISKFESLNLKSELELFEFVEKWAMAEAGRKGISDQEMATYFNRITKHIRFLTMDSTKYASGPGKSFLLNTEEKLNIGLKLMNNFWETGPREFTNTAKTFAMQCKFNINIHLQEQLPIYSTTGYFRDGDGLWTLKASMHKFHDKFLFKISADRGHKKFPEIIKLKAQFKSSTGKIVPENLNDGVEVYLCFPGPQHNSSHLELDSGKLQVPDAILMAIPSRDLFNEGTGYKENHEIILDLCVTKL